MWPASSHKRRSGRLDLGRDRRRRGLGVGDLRSCCGVIASTDRFRSRSLRLACPRMLGVRSHGVKVQQNGCPRDLPAYASVRHIAITGSPRTGRRNGCWWSGRRASRRRPNIGFQRFRRPLASVSLSISSSCAGALSATTTNSNRKLALATSRGEAGVASTITQHCALPPTDFWSPSERRFPPQKQPPPSYSRKLHFLQLVGHGDPPLRPERHVPNSIATVRRRLNVALVSTLSRCPSCIRPIASRSRYQKL